MASVVGALPAPPFVSETARERETFTFDDLGITTATVRGASQDPDKLIPTSILSSTPDRALTAFAELGLYRLSATHSIVSLFDRTYQHFVAEAVRCNTIGDDGALEPDGRHIFCGTAIPRNKSVCEQVLTGIAEGGSRSGNDGLGAGDLPVSVIANLDLDPRSCYLRDQNRRFYAGVPIRSPSGINIGVYCVLDDKPRPNGLTGDQIQFVREISQTVMGYLHAKRSNEWYRREERMVRGLGSFVEGHATLSNWSEHLDISSFRDIPGVREGALNKKLQAIPHKRVFSKACNIIRESIEVEGVLFLDASVRTFGGLVGNEVFEPPILERSSSTDSDSDDSQSGFPNPNNDQQHCNILGFSTSAGSSINGNKPAHAHTVVSERLLQRLLQRYPHGRIFNFEPDASDHSEVDDSSFPMSPVSAGSLHPSGPDEEMKGHGHPTRSRNYRNLATWLQRIFSGVRSLAFVPLFDGQKHRWFAGGFVWTKTSTRIFTPENELSYLRVFGLATMAEVARLNTRAADKTKTDILGSISHELRSPLHGVVGSVELLRNTVLDGTQESILRTIETSGRTLLDTIDHLLDYSKVNNIVRSAARPEQGSPPGSGPRSRARSNTSTVPTLSGPPLCVRLDRLAEEVVESVLAGWSYRNMSEANIAAWTSMMKGSPKPSGDSSASSATESHQVPAPFRPAMPHARNRRPVQIYLDIDHSVNWTFQTHPGAFRRIVLNLFGNSLKFTKAGFIRVSLHQEPNAKGGKKVFDGNIGARLPQTQVVLKVSDSGKGISQEYLSNNLFTPFSQEDQFAPGTGLGLSLVKQMVVALGGTIDVLSQAGNGTTVTVHLPIPAYIPSNGDASANLSEEIDAGFDKNIRHHLAGKKIHLQGFDNTLHLRDSIFDQEDSKQKTQVQLLESICQGWLKMDVVVHPPLQLDGVTQTVMAEEDYVLSLYQGSRPGGMADGPTSGVEQFVCPHLLVCRDANTMYALMKPGVGRRGKGAIPYLGVSYIAQPIGPRKLADALVASRMQWEKHRNGTSPQDGATDNPLAKGMPKTPTAASKDASKPLTRSPTPLSPSTRPKVRLRMANSTPSTPILSVLPLCPKNKDVLPLPLDSAIGESALPVSSLDGSGLSDVVRCPEGEESEPSKQSILIVDDNAINIKILTAYMTKLKHPFVPALNGLEAMEIYTSSPEKFRCIVTDISMPVMDGLESTRRIREFERVKKLKPVTVIALTGLSGDEIQQDAFVSGVDLFLTRPLVFKGLEKALEMTGHGPGSGGSSCRGKENGAL
ncbi:hypothetical protein QBC37DRAFT_476060 [Rhypophila decipiens]|uniref:histidine kinase n=1 Tax=Rhypophila decipiens TaxID=261697 RepID=A0AAN6Y1F5_9PEZI|nr:hypothetical protein QBC37DRAFT_476060 [Rhypophila decipiens]